MSELARRVARYRVRLGFPSAVLALWLAQPTERSLAAGAIVALVGEGLRIWAAGHLEKGREVTASGPYRFSRHPLYLGSTIIGVGFAIAAASVAAACVVVAYLAITLTAAMRGGSPPDRKIRHRLSSVSRRPRAGRAATLQHDARDFEPRVSSRCGARSRACAAVVEGFIIVVFG